MKAKFGSRLVKASAALVLWIAATAVALAGPPERWLHVNVKSHDGEAETVRVNLPLSLAEKVLPAVNSHNLCNGKLTLHGNVDVNGVDLRAIVEALKTTSDTEFVTVESGSEHVRISKSNGDVLVKVRDGKGHSENVDVKVPFAVVEALVSGPKDQLDLLAGIRALEAYGDTALVTVNDDHDSVRIWVDTRNDSE
jgi:hypothetical protein